MKSIDTQDPCIYHNRNLLLLYISSENLWNMKIENLLFLNVICQLPVHSLILREIRLFQANLFVLYPQLNITKSMFLGFTNVL